MKFLAAVNCGTSTTALDSDGLDMIILWFCIRIWGKIHLKKAVSIFDISRVRDIVSVACVLHNNFCYFVIRVPK